MNVFSDINHKFPLIIESVFVNSRRFDEYTKTLFAKIIELNKKFTKILL